MLKHTVARLVPTLYIPNQVRMTWPVDNSLPAGATTIAYQRIMDHGDLEEITQRSNDLAEVTLSAEEDIHRLVSYGGYISYSLDELEAAAFASVAISTELLGVLNRAAERSFELVSLRGQASKGITGVYNNANIALSVPVTGTWATATHDQIIGDIRFLVPANRWQYMGVRRANTDLSVMRAIQDEWPGLQVTDNFRANTYNVAGTGPRLMAFTYSPDLLKIAEPRRFQLEPPEKRGFTFQVAGRSKLGGAQVSVPLSAGYMDGI
jgi:hypothetical protein